MPLLPFPFAHVRSLCAMENSQLVHFKDWLPKANRKYQEIVTAEKRREEERRRQQLQAEIVEAERRQRILRSTRI